MDERKMEAMEERGRKVRDEIRKTRHKSERLLHGLSVAATVIILGFITLVGIGSSYLDTAGRTEEEMEVLQVFRMFGGFLALVFLAVLALFMLREMYREMGRTFCYNVRVTEKNFPEIYEKAQEFTALLGMKKTPAIYVVQQNGILNAFASAVPSRRYICLNAEVVDVAYMEHHDFAPVFMILAHEFGHQYLNHVTLAYNVSEFGGRCIPVFSQAVNRAREYSADRVAQALTGSGVKELSVLIAGRHLYPYVDVDDYLENTWKNRGLVDKIACFCINLFASHPVNYLRFRAMADPEKKSGRLFLT